MIPQKAREDKAQAKRNRLLASELGASPRWGIENLEVYEYDMG